MNDIVLRAEGISFSYDKAPFIDDLSFCIKKGEMISILGENGSGKTTLMHILSGALKPKGGRVLFEEKDIFGISLKQRAKKIAAVYQNTKTNFPFSCFEIVSMGIYPHKAPFERMNRADVDFITKIMKLTRTYCFCNKKITELSGGERQRVILAKALVQNPELLFLDEAVSNLDIASRIRFISLLKKICEENNMTVIMIVHDLSSAFEYSHKIMAMKNGRMLYFDESKKLINEEFFKSVFGVKADIYSNDRFFIHSIC